MFENTIAKKRMEKKNNLLNEIEKAKEEGNDWKLRQLEGKLADFNAKKYPTVFWDTMQKGTYKKPKEEKE